MFLTTTNEIWEAVRYTYFEAKDAAIIYNKIKMKFSTTKQGNLSAIDIII